jgi:hypothetical protein
LASFAAVLKTVGKWPYKQVARKADYGVGDGLQPFKVCVLLVLLSQAISAPVVALANTVSVRRSPRVESIKKQMKLQKKQQKKVRKFQIKAEKKWKKQHHVER